MGVSGLDHYNLRAPRELLDAQGVPYRVADVPLTGVRQIFMQDPAGNGVELNFVASDEG